MEVDNLEERRPLLDGVAAALDQALPLLRPSSSTDTDDEDPWAWKLTSVNVELKARKAESRLARALLAILRNLAQVPINRGAIANHPVLLHHVLDLLEPELLGLESRPSRLTYSCLWSSTSRSAALFGTADIEALFVARF